MESVLNSHAKNLDNFVFKSNEKWMDKMNFLQISDYDHVDI